MVARDSHDGEVKLLVKTEDICVFRGAPHHSRHGLCIQLQVFREPAENALMRSDAAMLKEKVIKDAFKWDIDPSVLAVHHSDWVVFTDDLTCLSLHPSGQIEDLGALLETEKS